MKVTVIGAGNMGAASVFFPPFWGVSVDQAFVTRLLFFKNIAVAGGVLTLVAHGAGGLEPGCVA